MTGNETIIIKGGKALLGKVRHDGMDMEEWLLEIGDKVFAFDTPSQVWAAYWERHHKYEGAEIESAYQETGFEFDCGGTKDFDELIGMAEETLRLLEEQRQKTDPDYDEGLLCGYSDYIFLIDMDTKEITPSLEEEKEEEA